MHPTARQSGPAGREDQPPQKSLPIQKQKERSLFAMTGKSGPGTLVGEWLFCGDNRNVFNRNSSHANRKKKKIMETTAVVLCVGEST